VLNLLKSIDPIGVGIPVAPVAPVSPVGPTGPISPVGPVSPVAPVDPVSPVAPVVPVAPFILDCNCQIPPIFSYTSPLTPSRYKSPSLPIPEDGAPDPEDYSTYSPSEMNALSTVSSSIQVGDSSSSTPASTQSSESTTQLEETRFFLLF
jgi:hypothetical protein